MPVRVVTSRSSQPLTVNALLQNPLVLPERIISFMENQFVMDQILRNAGKATGGAVQYRVSSGQFADDGVEIVAEGGEIPLATVTKGDLASKPVQKRALGVAITQEMRDRNNLGEIERQLQAVRNTMVRDIDGAFFTTLAAAVTQVRPATATWATTSTATIRKDINAAKLLIKKAVTPGASAKDYLGFQPTHLLLSVESEADLLNSPEFMSLIFGSANASNIGSLSDAPDANVLGLKPLVSIGLAAGTAYVVEQNTVGGYADERPLQATELYEKRENELWRSDASRLTAGFVDQPLAIASITGV
jgi:hypothetical protein